MHVPLLDLTRQYTTIRDEIRPAMDQIIEAQSFILGDAVTALESEISEYCGGGVACGVSSGTDALIIALMAAGIGEGHEVITSPFTFFATAGAIHRVGARPVFVDIDPLTFNLDPNAIARAVTDRTRAIMPVHLFGQACDMGPILEIAAARNLIVVEDAAQAIGSEYKGRRVGMIGDYGCFSFFPSKNLGGFGDGGMTTARDPERVSRLRMLRVHGGKQRYFHDEVGGNFRLDALQAAVLSVKLRHLDSWTAARQANASVYHEAFADAENAGLLTRPVTAGTSTRHIWNQYTLRILGGRRDEVLASIQGAGVGAGVYYPLCLHEQVCFSYLGGRRGDCPHAELAADEVLSIPVFPELTDEERNRVIEVVLAAVVG